MKYAIVNNSKTAVDETEATTAHCPCCNSEMVARRGNIMVHHWAHKSLIECDSYFEPKTEWHVRMQNLLSGNDKTKQEVIIEKDNVKHIADIVNNKGVVIECQHSPISQETIVERETFYNDMIWLFDAETFCKNWEIVDTFNDKYNATMVKVVCKYYRGTLDVAKKPIYFNFADRDGTNNFLRLKNIYRSYGKIYANCKVMEEYAFKWYVENKLEPYKNVTISLDAIRKFKETILTTNNHFENK